MCFRHVCLLSGFLIGPAIWSLHELYLGEARRRRAVGPKGLRQGANYMPISRLFESNKRFVETPL